MIPEHLHPRLLESLREQTVANPQLLNGLPATRQTAGGLKLTSGSGEQTFIEATFRFNKERKNFYLIDLHQLYHGYWQTD